MSVYQITLFSGAKILRSYRLFSQPSHVHVEDRYSFKNLLFKGTVRLWTLIQVTLDLKREKFPIHNSALSCKPWPFSKSKFNLKSDRVNLVAPASPISVCFIYPMSGRYSTAETGKVDPARKFKCATAVRALEIFLYSKIAEVPLT